MARSVVLHFLRVVFLAAGKNHLSLVRIKLKPEAAEANRKVYESFNEICICCSIPSDHLDGNPLNMQYLKSSCSGAFSMWQSALAAESECSE